MIGARRLNVEPEEYHRLPGFSASLAKVLVAKSPLHARDVFERGLEEEVEDEDDDDASKKDRLDIGSILHAMILGKGGKRIEVLPYDKYSTKKAREDRDAVRAAGKIPVKKNKWEMYQRQAAAMKSRIELAGHTLDGESEVGIEWFEQGTHGEVRCRCMVDHLVTWCLDGKGGAPGAIIFELKCVGDAQPQRCERTAEGMGYGIAAAAYMRALTALYPQLGGRIEFRFLWCEFRRPYDVYDPVPDGIFMELGANRWTRAVNAWSHGESEGVWPGYKGIATMSAPMWALKQEGYNGEEV